MTDIVERLRDWSKQAGTDFWAQDDAALLWEAADEIEQLRQALRHIEDECSCGMAPSSSAVNWERVATRAAGYARDALKEGER